MLETNIGLYADERTITLTDADFVDGVYDLSKQVYHREGIYTTSAGSIAREDFDSENRGYAEITYAVAEGWKAVPKRQIFTRSIFVGTFDDVEIVPAGQLPVTFNFVYEEMVRSKKLLKPLCSRKGRWRLRCFLRSCRCTGRIYAEYR